jgi:hypothetical protein
MAMDLLLRAAQRLGKLLDLSPLQEIHVVPDHRLLRGLFHVEGADLDEQALPQVPRGDSGRIELLDLGQHPLDVRRGGMRPSSGSPPPSP